PPILGGIMRDPNANERHRIESIKTLDALASTGAEAAAAGARFEIIINLGADMERYSKSIKPDANDVDPFNDPGTSATPQELIPVVEVKKEEDNGGSGHL